MVVHSEILDQYLTNSLRGHALRLSQLKRIFASKSVQKRYVPTRWGFAAIFKSLPQSRDTLLF